MAVHLPRRHRGPTPSDDRPEHVGAVDVPRDGRSAGTDLERFAAHAAALGVTATVVHPAEPFVITGVVDGRGFYLRERCDLYRVTVASDQEAAADPWSLPADRLMLDIASGGIEDLCGPDGQFDKTLALSVAVDAVRTFLHRRSCRHLGLRGAGVEFCATCGVRLTEAHVWRGDG